MINAVRISAFEKSELPEVSKTLSAEDVRQLVEWLTDFVPQMKLMAIF